MMDKMNTVFVPGTTVFVAGWRTLKRCFEFACGATADRQRKGTKSAKIEAAATTVPKQSGTVAAVRIQWTTRRCSLRRAGPVGGAIGAALTWY
jgi:hypothetical protein